MAIQQDFEQLKPLRLHELSSIFLFIDTLKEFFLVFAIALFSLLKGSSAGGLTWELWAIGASAIFVLLRMISFRFFKYWILPEELVVKSGVIFRQERHIPYERIQNINQTEGILHRLFKVCKVQLESASGGRPEATFNVISLSAVKQLQHAVTQRGQINTHINENVVNESRGTDSKPLLKLSGDELVKHGVITNQGIIPIAMFFAYLSQQEQFLSNLFLPWFDKVVPGLNDISAEQLLASPGLLIAGLFGLFLFCLVFFWVLSIGVSIFRFHGYQLTKNDDKLQAKMGLLTRNSANASLKRMQKITWRETPLHRLFKRVSITCKTAGNAGDNGNGYKSFRYLAPLIPTNAAQTFLTSIDEQQNWSLLDQNHSDWQAIPFRAWSRMVKSNLFFILLVLLIAYFFIEWRAFFLLLLVPLAVYDARRSARAAGFICNDDFIAYRSGWLFRNISIVRLHKAQAVSMRQNLFDRRRAMASLAVDTAGFSFTDHRIDMSYLEYADAERMHKQISAKANELEFEW